MGIFGTGSSAPTATNQKNVYSSPASAPDPSMSSPVTVNPEDFYSGLGEIQDGQNCCVKICQADQQQLSIGQITLTAAAPPILISAYNRYRESILITNPDPANSVVIGNFDVTAVSGQIILPLNSLSIPTTAAVYGITSAGTIRISFIETQQAT